MWNGLKKVLLEGRFLGLAIQKIDKLLAVAARKFIYKRGKVQNNKLFFMTYDNKYSCNLQYIAEEVIRQNLPVEMVWATEKKNIKLPGAFPKQITLVERGTTAMFEQQASAKIWFDNALNCVWYGMPKKRGQIYINTWHGSMGIKRLSGNRLWKYRAKQCRKMTDYCISNSLFEEDVYRNTFWPDSEYLRFGHARNDILLQKEKHDQIIDKVRSYFNMDEETKCVLYAPTFRDDGTTSCFNIHFDQLRNALEKKFGGKWCILVRMHFKNRNIKLSQNWNEWLKDASTYPDMQELLVAADVGITDYSSWAYDYVITKKPLFIYATDIEKYNNTRGFYYPLETTPFSISKSNNELEANIDAFDNKQYLKKCDVFLEEKGCMEDGHASERIVELLKEVIGI